MTHDTLDDPAAAILDALHQGDARQALELARESGFLWGAARRAPQPIVLESLWAVLRDLAPFGHLPAADRPGAIRAALGRRVRQHLATWGTAAALGCEDEERLGTDRDACRNLRRGKAWRRRRRVDDAPERAVDPRGDVDGALSLYLECMNAAATDQERELVHLLATEAVSGREALARTGVTRGTLRGLRKRIFSAREPKTASASDIHSRAESNINQ